MTKNEAQKTGIFWGAAGVTAILAAIIAWPNTATMSESEGGGIAPGTVLLPTFSDPLAAANMKIVTFDDEQGTLSKFEVLRDKETGVWTIPSRGGYPADAVEQMRNAANALVDLKVLDSPTAFAEDHEGFGVIEPVETELAIGDEGVGRLVSFFDQDGKELGSLIIGKPVEGQDGQVFVRIPGQDPVYSVALDDSPLTTKFEDWIEEDLLQLSSIDVQKVQLKDYTSELKLERVGLQQRLVIDTKRNYEATVEMDGTEWKLNELKEFDPDNANAPPTVVEVDESKKLNKTKLDGIKSALDDLKFVNVQRKPEGISANLKADEDFANDQEANAQLAGRGFYPVRDADGELDLLSANGELSATTKEGVRYVLRFGNISGLGEKEEESDASEGEEGETEQKPKPSSAGVNRYLMVSTRVDDSMFPPPDLEVVPETLEDLDAMDKAEEQAAQPEGKMPVELTAPETKGVAEPEMKDEPAESEPENVEKKETTDPEEPTKDPAEAEKTEEMPEDSAEQPETQSEEPAKTDEPAKTAEDSPEGEPESEPEAADAVEEATGEEPASGEVESSGSGESTTVGEGQEKNEPAADSEDADSQDDSDKETTAADETEKPAADPDADAPTTESESEEKAAETKPDAEADKPAEKEVAEETEEEKKERLAAVQERITKANERKIDDRKDKLAAAKRRSRELNERFADWYYVIPEATYSKLMIRKDDLFDNAPAAPSTGGPGMNFGSPGGFQIPGVGN